MEKSGEVRLEKRRRENEKKSRNKRELARKAPRTRRKFRLGTVRGICHPHVTCRGEPGPFALPLSSNEKSFCFDSVNFVRILAGRILLFILEIARISRS